jgi:LmbE family N-acetylglucosaminyl deacetylase
VVTDGTGEADAAAHEWRPSRFMVIAAHPDDAEFGPAATAAKWIDEGSVGWLVCCTSGDQGGEDPEADPLELALLREEEQRAAAAVIGYAGVSFLNQPDGALANDLALRELLVREIRTFRPDAILATDPEALFYADGGVNHTDHRAAGLAAVDRWPSRGWPATAWGRIGSGGSTSSGRTPRPSGSTSAPPSDGSSTHCEPMPVN